MKITQWANNWLIVVKILTFLFTTYSSKYSAWFEIQNMATGKERYSIIYPKKENPQKSSYCSAVLRIPHSTCHEMHPHYLGHLLEKCRIHYTHSGNPFMDFMNGVVTFSSKSFTGVHFTAPVHNTTKRLAHLRILKYCIWLFKTQNQPQLTWS